MQSMNDNIGQKLNDMLQGEMSAVETYNQALKKVDDPSIRAELTEAQQCHLGRVQTLQEKVIEAGITPAKTSGAWGAFAKTVEGGAALLGDRAAVSILEEGEDKGLKDYKNLLNDTSMEVRPVVAMLLERQMWTHQKVSDLKHRMQ